MLTVLAPAKINLSLEVLRGRSDGYHDLLSVVQTVSLADALSLRPGPGRSIRCLDHELERGNLAERAAGILAERFGVSDGVRIDLHKRIPVAAGLGGGSTDAAAALAGLSRFWELEAGCRELEPIAAEIGSDVPFFLQGGRARVEGRGEKVTREATRGGWFAIAWPGIELATSAVYEAWDETGGRSLRHAAERVEPKLKAFADRLGAGWTMTGSGSAFFKPAGTRQEANQAIAELECWTAVATAVAIPAASAVATPPASAVE